MEISLHKLARTTPSIRAEIQASTLPSRELSKKYGVSVPTINKWRNRDTAYDKSHARHNLLSSLSSRDEEVVRELREKLNLSLDDITEIMNRCINPNLTRSSIYRAMKRCGIAKRPHEAGEAVSQRFEQVVEPGFIHMDVKYLTKLEGKRSYVYVAIDRMTRYVYAEVLENLEPATAAGFVERFTADFPYEIKKIVTDNGFEWTDRFSGGAKESATGKHPVDIICQRLNIKHSLTRVRRPQTNGMVERFNRRINEAIGRKEKLAHNGGKNSFYTHQERNEFITQFVYNYNRTRLRCLEYRAPIELLNNNQTEHNT